LGLHCRSAASAHQVMGGNCGQGVFEPELDEVVLFFRHARPNPRHVLIERIPNRGRFA
jgi:hypothetical protein